VVSSNADLKGVTINAINCRSTFYGIGLSLDDILLELTLFNNFPVMVNQDTSMVTEILQNGSDE